MNVPQDAENRTSSSSSSGISENLEDDDTCKELSRRLPTTPPAHRFSEFDDSDFMPDSGLNGEYSAGDIKWLFDARTSTFSAHSKVVIRNDKQKQYEQKLVLPVDPSICSSEESVGFQLQKNVFNQAFQHLATGVPSNLPVPTSHTAYLSNNEKVTIHTGRYLSDFDELRIIGRGGFAKVLEVRHKVDRQTYAVKRVQIKSPPENLTLEKLSQEVTILAKLTKNPCSRIVRYHAAWLEEEFRTRSGSGTGVDKTCQKDNHPTSSSESSSSSSEEENLNNITEDSDSSIVFKDSQDTQAKLSEVQFVSPAASSQLSSSSRETVTKQAFYFYSKEQEIVSKGNYSSAVVERSSHKVVEHKGVMSKQEIAGALSLRHPRRRHSSKPLTKYVLYIQMELCGKTLSTWLNTRNNNFQETDEFTCVNYKQNIHILRQILEGIHFVHEQDILHRDLKPLNVFLTEPQLDIKIGDFGLAREVICQEEEELDTLNPRSFGRQLSSDVGTSPYIAPEQMHGSDYDSKADMYSFGIIKYEMFHPFQTGHERIVCIKKLREEGDIPEKIFQHWPEEANLIKLLTSKDKVDRPSASEVLHGCVYCADSEKTKATFQKQLNQRDSVIMEQEKELEDQSKQLALKVKELEKLVSERDKERRAKEEKDKLLKEKTEKLRELEAKLQALEMKSPGSR